MTLGEPKRLTDPPVGTRPFKLACFSVNNHLNTLGQVNIKNLTSLSCRGVLPILDLREKESEKWQEGRVTRLDVDGSKHREQRSRQLGGKVVGTTALITASSKKGEVKRRLCAVVWLSDHNHLFTGESEGREEPLQRVGTTRQSCGKVGHV
ncbi:hypothetical protein CRG98_002333 [Punica granatum]|uniref:Uncharacterized protein n=1 Tax=Punica granatum TaxID=22663 RepID=A0A2I0L988_PUNGR|nr:hypothetical protein CRG98_002333 [Punica granatum]